VTPPACSLATAGAPRFNLDMPQRKGSTSIKAIPASVLRDLNAGTIESKSLVECLAIDFPKLLSSAIGRLKPAELEPFAGATGITQKMSIAASVVASRSKPREWSQLSSHPSDTIRGVVCYVLAQRADSLDDALEQLKPFAADAHFGVREWAWLAVRPQIAAEIDRAIELLTPWTSDDREGVRRFASESTRPRGVWCGHIKRLRESPQLALPILDPLHADESEYVQKSVANWLNDAGKDQPAWVKSICAKWTKQSKSKATAAIVKRAMRSLGE
jgi:3-methyladenine DNA glycosylase AlkC